MHALAGVEGFNDMQFFGGLPTFPTFVKTGQMWTIAPAEAVLPNSSTTSTAAPPALPIASTSTATSSTTPALGTGGSTTTKRRTPTSSATGTHKNLTPQALIPLEAPTQKHTYVVPAVFRAWLAESANAKEGKGDERTHASAFPNEAEEELGELSPTATLAEMYKRRQNTIAARGASAGVEGEIRTLRRQVEVWREHAGVLGGMLRARGVALGEWEEIAADERGGE
ncbi:hypothetical protein C8J57DRAFT_1594548 [Mycena rebaudengoi]|nr:hypothetical protein C8J57DRAFT_1594548 [Mycena rebaudengoi]